MNIPNAVVKQNPQMSIDPQDFITYEALVRDCAKTAHDDYLRAIREGQPFNSDKAILARYSLEPKDDSNDLP